MLQGFVDAIQLVMIAAVPQLKEEVVQNVPVVIVDTDSDNETAREPAPQNQPLAMARFVVIPGHAKDLDSRCQVSVQLILVGTEFCILYCY